MAERLWRHVKARRTPDSPIGIEVTIGLKQHPYDVTVTLMPNDTNMVYEPVAIEARRNDGGELSPRAVQKLPLGRAAAGAKAFLRSADVQQAVLFGRPKDVTIDVLKLDKAMPRPSSKDDPERRHRIFMEIYRKFEARPDKWPAGAKTPAEAVALQLKMPRNRVDQMKHRAKTRYGIDV